MPQFALEMRQVSKTYGSVRANDSITFQVKKGTIHGLAGENGAGKSTLMKILFGLEEVDKTSDANVGVFIDGKKVRFESPLDAIKSGIGMVQQHFALAGALSALDNIILGAEPGRLGIVDRPQAQKTLEALAGKNLSLPWQREAEDLSVGLQQRIEILKLLFRKADILILDEPTAVLTPQEVETFFALLRDLRSQGKTIILITHKLNEVFSLCDQVTVLRQGKVTGGFEIAGLNRETLIRAMIGRDINPTKKRNPQSGGPLLEVRDLWAETLSRGSLKGVSLDVHKKEIVGIAGVEGHGQSVLVEALLGLIEYTGQIQYEQKAFPAATSKIRRGLNIGLISEDRHSQSLWMDASIAENCVIGSLGAFSKFGILNSHKISEHSENLLAPYGVKMEAVSQKVSSLSGGNQQKIVVAREISMRNPKFLIASQPTRGVDIGAIEFIHSQIVSLRDAGSGVLLISSELDELCELSDRILVLYEGRLVASFTGPQFSVKDIGRAMTTGSAS